MQKGATPKTHKIRPSWASQYPTRVGRASIERGLGGPVSSPDPLHLTDPLGRPVLSQTRGQTLGTAPARHIYLQVPVRHCACSALCLLGTPKSAHSARCLLGTPKCLLGTLLGTLLRQDDLTRTAAWQEKKTPGARVGGVNHMPIPSKTMQHHAKSSKITPRHAKSCKTSYSPRL